MSHRFSVQAVDRSLREKTNNRIPFGGKAFVFCGYFRQKLPVIYGGSQAQNFNAFLSYYPMFALVSNLRLNEKMPLSALREDPNADSEGLSVPEYLLQVGASRVAGSQAN